MSAIADKILGGWSVSGIATFRTGLYLGPARGTSAIVMPHRSALCRADLTRTRTWTATVWILQCSTSMPSIGLGRSTPFASERYGTAAVNRSQGNGINTWDMAVLKNIAWGDRYRIQFRWEMFNAFNHASFGQPSCHAQTLLLLRPCDFHSGRAKGNAVWLEVLFLADQATRTQIDILRSAPSLALAFAPL